jgi:hypothetical protein
MDLRILFFGKESEQRTAQPVAPYLPQHQFDVGFGKQNILGMKGNMKSGYIDIHIPIRFKIGVHMQMWEAENSEV